MNKILRLLLLLPVAAFGQKEDLNIHNYPQDYFRNPLDIPIFLAGNFGECRPGHFHSGVDIKTEGKENQPVHAAADGYISRIKMEKGGFGHAIYITHPNGYTTLYAHLNDFAPAIQKFVRSQQYEKERWDVDLQLSPEQFPVKKGQQIAWSGNTGSSTAPHLHFEIRNTKTEHPLNPELFGLPIKDTEPPVVYEVAVYDLDKSIYEQKPEIVSLKGRGGIYVPIKNDTINTTNMIVGIGINVKDFMNGSDNDIAFYTATLYIDDSIQCRVRLDDIGYDETRYVNAYADYKTHELDKKWIQCLFELPGNKLNHIYEKIQTVNNVEFPVKGSFNIKDDKNHKIKIEITDDRGNVSVVNFYLKRSYSIPADLDDSSKKRILKFNPPVIKKDSNEFVYNFPNSFERSNIKFELDNSEIYSDINFIYKIREDNNNFSDRHQIHYSYVPLHHYFDLFIKPNKPIPFDLKSKIVMRYSDGKDEDGRAAIAEDKGWYKASVRNFGTYWLVADTVAPVIKSLQKNGANLGNAKQITFVVKDALTSVKRFRGEIDGKWVCFEQHNDLFFYRFDEHCSHGKHKLVFTATDENNNTAKFTLNFTK
jgi:hypothetical protein